MSTPTVPGLPTLLGTTELVESIARQANVHRPLVRDVLAHLETIVSEALESGRRVRLPGIGILEARPTRARTGTSPTGHAWTRPASRRVHLTPATTLAAAVRGASPEASDA